MKTGLLSKAQLSKERTKEAEIDENEKLESYENEISNYNHISGNREVTDEEIETKIKNVLNNYYQKLRSDNYEEVSFINGKKFIAPCDGYYCFSTSMCGETARVLAYCDHYTSGDVLIARHNAGAYFWGDGGAEIYMKKNEYIVFLNEGSTSINSSKFFYAVDCKPDATK